MDASACWLGNASSDLVNSQIAGDGGGPRIRGGRHGGDLFIPYGEFPDLGDFILRECGDYEVAGNFPNNACVTQQNGYTHYLQTEELLSNHPFVQPDYHSWGLTLVPFTQINIAVDRYNNTYVSGGFSVGAPNLGISLSTGFIWPINNHTIPTEAELGEKLMSGSLSVSGGWVAQKTIYITTVDWNTIEEGITPFPTFGITWILLGGRWNR